MIQRITTAEYATSAELASYLSMPEDMTASRKSELERALSRATEAVENKYNISLREMNILLTLHNIEEHSYLYHHPISNVSYCKGNGVELPFTFDGVGVAFVGSYRVLQVAYTTTATPDAEHYHIEVLDRASSIFNGDE